MNSRAALSLQSKHVRPNFIRSTASPVASYVPRPSLPSTPSSPQPRNLDPSMNPVEKARKRMGYKNNWSRQEVDESNQLVWANPLKDAPRVAIVGGGLSGLVCALALAKKGIRSVVFDTGEHSMGGRLATRVGTDKSIRGAWVRDGRTANQLIFDHAAQFFTATDPRFVELVGEWVAAGAVKTWRGGVGTLVKGRFVPFQDNQLRYVGAGGMRKLAIYLNEHLQSKYGNLVEFQRPMWVSKLQAQTQAGAWQLLGKQNNSLGLFDFVVIAHNGKCANRLVGPTGAPLVAKQLMGLRLSAVWACMVAFERPVDTPGGMEGAFVDSNPVLSWVGNNTAKLRSSQAKTSLGGIECWTLISTNAYGQKNKVPQEAIPEDVQAKISNEMLTSFAASMGKSLSDLPPVTFTRCQLWGAALPVNTPGVECVVDPESRVGICGDWLMQGSMQAAAVSGISLADKISRLRGIPMTQLEPFKIGLRAPFKQLSGETPIGAFPK